MAVQSRQIDRVPAATLLVSTCVDLCLRFGDLDRGERGL